MFLYVRLLVGFIIKYTVYTFNHLNTISLRIIFVEFIYDFLFFFIAKDISIFFLIKKNTDHQFELGIKETKKIQPIIGLFNLAEVFSLMMFCHTHSIGLVETVWIIDEFFVRVGVRMIDMKKLLWRTLTLGEKVARIIKKKLNIN